MSSFHPGISHTISPKGSFDQGYSTPHLSPTSSVCSSSHYTHASSSVSSHFSPTSAVDYSEDVNKYKSATDKYREKVGNLRALQLLEVTTIGDTHRAAMKPLSPTVAREAAIRKYEANKILGKKNTGVVQMDMEQKATTTRKMVKRPEDVRDPDTVAGMLYPIDIDRQKEAKKKALRLIDSPMYARVYESKDGIEVIV